ncbi:S1C family serine protease [Niallia sp. Krafla_26]|uniref:S1C family serine protease n=1 Tax=Niallia sp. Krafla_26 TaxID=3064703 RepID=UPI003D16A4F6
MNPYNEQNNSRVEAPQKQRKPRIKGFMTTLAGGIIGSVLTLTVVSNTDYFPAFNGENEQQVPGQLENTTTKSGAVNIQPTSTTSSNSIADMVDQASKSIVGIVNRQKQTLNQGFFTPNKNQSETVESGSGTGVIFKIDGEHAYIVTNNHVIEGAQEIEVTVHGGEKTTAELIGADSLTDLAVLKIDAKYASQPLEIGNSDSLRAGDTVLAIGNPLGLDLSNTVTQGIVSAVDRTIAVSTSAGKRDLNVIQTDAAINPGNSGGALVNTSGQLMGINSLKIAEDGVEGLGFAIPSNDLVPIINEIMEKGKVERPYIGVGLADLSQIPQIYIQNLPNEIEGGAVVTNIDPNSAGAKAGFQVQDVIVSINGQSIRSSNDLRKYLYTELEVGDQASFEVYRGNEKKTIDLTLSSSH